MLRTAGRVVLAAFALAGVFAAVSVADAAKPKKRSAVKLTKEEKAFRERLAKLKKEHPSSIINIRLAVDDAAAIPGSASANALTLVAGKRQLEVPSTLSPEDIGEVINDHLGDVKRCYKKQLEEDPEWNDELILDLAIKKTGRVSEVSVAPRRVKRDPIGVCLMSTVPKWKFPQFTGESDDGVTQEVVTASFPFTLEQPQ